ncbi:50S ribosomal protein L6 [Malaciobacter mytili]|uniref:Large ribosomal subunit protein uL6 n=1 Tax=Malaciobacter mytili LMG 24559 TaxID=1032238 RepID=A0AAX2AJ20_9BACT|nr:50S ribosomal protein L6 [Malaciobacter mytili]AXH14571.1 50S ribosomal protein L6 [Malaciobacter mytili LMG 24559]RXK16625.1 50S ribosomal protein L6 [Malaciobacter mytili LMG 24559]
MSRIGKKPISIPSGIEITVDGTVVNVKKGNKVSSVETHGRVGIELSDNQIVLSRADESQQASAYWGTYRALINNAVVGLSDGFSKSLEINGVGYRAAIKGNALELQLGYSHPINYEIPAGLEITVDKNVINVKGADKQQVGQAAAVIRGFRKPEPYKGKGVKYSDEVIVRKAGKTAKK